MRTEKNAGDTKSPPPHPMWYRVRVSSQSGVDCTVHATEEMLEKLSLVNAGDGIRSHDLPDQSLGAR